MAPSRAFCYSGVDRLWPDRGQLVYERYFGVLKPDGQHAAMSVTTALKYSEDYADPTAEV